MDPELARLALPRHMYGLFPIGEQDDLAFANTSLPHPMHSGHYRDGDDDDARVPLPSNETEQRGALPSGFWEPLVQDTQMEVMQDTLRPHVFGLPMIGDLEPLLEEDLKFLRSADAAVLGAADSFAAGMLAFQRRLAFERRFIENAPREVRDGRVVFLHAIPTAAQSRAELHRFVPYYNQLYKADEGQFGCSSAAGVFTSYGNIRQSSSAMLGLFARPFEYSIPIEDPFVWKLLPPPIDPAYLDALKSHALLRAFIDNDNDTNWYAG